MGAVLPRSAVAADKEQPHMVQANSSHWTEVAGLRHIKPRIAIRHSQGGMTILMQCVVAQHARPPSFCDVNVVAVREQQRIADPSPGTFAPRPGTEELDWIALWLRPAAVGLDRLVKTPAKIPLVLVGDGAARQRGVPIRLPCI